jgi:plasmid stability protein
MRTTIDLPDDLHQAVTSIAAHSRRSMNQTVADLIRRGLAPLPGPLDAAAALAALRVGERTGLPLIRSPRPVTAEDVRARRRVNSVGGARGGRTGARATTGASWPASTTGLWLFIRMWASGSRCDSKRSKGVFGRTIGGSVVGL